MTNTDISVAITAVADFVQKCFSLTGNRKLFTECHFLLLSDEAEKSNQ